MKKFANLYLGLVSGTGLSGSLPAYLLLDWLCL